MEKKTVYGLNAIASLGLKPEQTYVDGKEFGIIKIYSRGALVLKTSDTLVNNDTLTSYEKYNAYGVVIERGQYVNHLRKGIWVKYRANGKTLRSKIDYQGKNTKVIIKDTIYPEDY
jgi:antitoxin component YwqK of YwqJK toxin-antitoxin module